MERFLVQEYGTLPSLDGAGCTNLSQSAISKWGWGFHTVRGGLDPEGHSFRP